MQIYVFIIILHCQVAIFRKRGDKFRMHCGGTLITEQHVLTAAHCFWDMYEQKILSSDEFLVKLGTHDTKNTNVDVLVKKIHLNAFNNNNFTNDIAILELKEKVRHIKQLTWIN